MNRSSFSTPSTPLTATLLRDIEHWDAAAEIKYDTSKGHYYSDAQKPLGNFTATAFHVLSRTAEDRSAHRAAIDHLAQEVSQKNPQLGNNFRDRFFLRRFLGQPLTPDSIDSFFTDSSHGSVKDALTDLQRGLSNILPRSSNFQYEPIRDDDEASNNSLQIPNSSNAPKNHSLSTASTYGAIQSIEQKDAKKQPLSSTTKLPVNSYVSYHEGSKVLSPLNPEEPRNLAALIMKAKTDVKDPTPLADPAQPPPLLNSSLLDRYYKRTGIKNPASE